MLGSVTFFVGLAITLGSLTGSPTYPDVLVPVFALSAMGNGLSGIMLAPKDPLMELGFQIAGAVQIALTWLILRMSGLWLPGARMVDFCGMITMFYSLVGIWRFAGTQEFGIIAAARVGVIGLALLSIYPAHFAIGGDEWFTCVCDRWPDQKRGFLEYVYVPAVWMMATMMFGATLWIRKIISSATFGIVFALGVSMTVFATVVMQEVWIPWVSTQRLYMPCPMPEPGTLSRTLTDTFDLSPAAQRFLDLFR